MTPQPPKPTTSEKSADKAPDPTKVEETETASEGAPALETPESPAAVPEETPRDETAPLETPEAPAPLDEEVVPTLLKDELKEEAAAHDLPVSGTKAELVERLVDQAQADAEAIEEDRRERYELHVSTSPVDAHAPVWTPRPPNTTGGYS